MSSAKDVPDGVGIITIASGDLWTNQTGGYACHHPEERGTYDNLRPNKSNLNDLLCNYFCGGKWNGWCCNGIDIETKYFLDAVLDTVSRNWSVDTARFKESEEAWIYIKALNNKVGVLVWENSD